MKQTEEEDKDGSSYSDGILLTLTGVRRPDKVNNELLEEQIASALRVAAERISVVDISENGEPDMHTGGSTNVMFAVFPHSNPSLQKDTAPQLARKMNEYIQTDDEAREWLVPTGTTDAPHCSVAELEEAVEIDEDEAFRIWHDLPDESRTAHLALVPSPDGAMIRPRHLYLDDAPAGDSDANICADAKYHAFSAVEEQLSRDPSLLEFDNVRRIHISQLEESEQQSSQDDLWNEPLIISGCCTSEVDEHSLLTKETLTQEFASVEVRTGNRNTLIENGFDNSMPMHLGPAIDEHETNSTTQQECCRIVFSPVKELPKDFRTRLRSILAMFPPFPTTKSKNDGNSNGNHAVKQKYTLCIAGREGFGIGFHKHNAALFLLMVGRKKWYIADSPPLDASTEPTHPGFYTTKSSHKCIQQPGEVLYVPDQWYHEIFNLEYTAGIQALPDFY